MNLKPESVVAAQEEFLPGQSVVVGGPSHQNAYEAVFEDDGDTGYFYGLDHDRKPAVLDALHIYDVLELQSPTKPSTAQIVWSGDGLKVILLINGDSHAAFDFSKRRGYCRRDFPKPSGQFSAEGHHWSDEVLKFF